MFKGKKILVSAGPTYERIDPVRFIGNRSSGKMGIAIAEAFANSGAEVTLVKGPTKISTEVDGIEVMDVESAEEMYQACISVFPDSDIAIMAAAVADYTPVTVYDQKKKKSGDDWTIELKRTKDILAEMGNMKKEAQILIGFALETENEMENARSKLERKNLDMIVLNSLRSSGAGFQHDTNQVTILDKLGNINRFDLKLKTEVAQDILKSIADYDSMPQSK